MTVTVQLTAQQTAERLIPILKDYAEKFSLLNQQSADILLRMTNITKSGALAVGFNAARLVCLQDAMDKPSAAIAQSASGLLEHSELEHVTWQELKLRLDEFEEHSRFSIVMIKKLIEILKQLPDIGNIRKDVAQNRYKAPF